MSSRLVAFIGEAPGKNTKHSPTCEAFEGVCGRILSGYLDVRLETFLKFAVRRNLFPYYPGEHWPSAQAREMAKRVRLPGEVVKVFLCGRRVAKAFGDGDAAFFEAFERSFPLTDGGTAVYETVVIPHPSRRSRWWNDRTNRAIAAAYLQQAGRHYFQTIRP